MAGFGNFNWGLLFNNNIIINQKNGESDNNELSNAPQRDGPPPPPNVIVSYVDWLDLPMMRRDWKRMDVKDTQVERVHKRCFRGIASPRKRTMM